MFISLRNDLVCVVNFRFLFVPIFETSVPVFCPVNVYGVVEIPNISMG